MNDEVMQGAVYKILLDSFLVDRPTQDVYVLAASRLSVDFLKQGFKELEKYRSEVGEVTRNQAQVGL